VSRRPGSGSGSTVVGVFLPVDALGRAGSVVAVADTEVSIPDQTRMASMGAASRNSGMFGKFQ